MINAVVGIKCKNIKLEHLILMLGLKTYPLLINLQKMT